MRIVVTGAASGLGLAIATSIDALAAGVTLPILGAPLLRSIATIGITPSLSGSHSSRPETTRSAVSCQPKSVSST